MRDLPFVIAAFLAAMATARADDIKDLRGQDDTARLQGVWRLDQDNGRRVPITMTIAKDTITIAFETKGTDVEDQGLERLSFKLDSTKALKEIDFMGPERKGGAVAGVYELDGDTLKLCIGPAGGERPKALAEGENGSRLQIWKRIK